MCPSGRHNEEPPPSCYMVPLTIQGSLASQSMQSATSNLQNIVNNVPLTIQGTLVSQFSQFGQSAAPTPCSTTLENILKIFDNSQKDCDKSGLGFTRDRSPCKAQSQCVASVGKIWHSATCKPDLATDPGVQRLVRKHMSTDQARWQKAGDTESNTTSPHSLCHSLQITLHMCQMLNQISMQASTQHPHRLCANFHTLNCYNWNPISSL